MTSNDEKLRIAMAQLSEAESDKIIAVKNGNLRAYHTACAFYEKAQREYEKALKQGRTSTAKKTARASATKKGAKRK
jgi:hypothetical protein